MRREKSMSEAAAAVVVPGMAGRGLLLNRRMEGDDAAWRKDAVLSFLGWAEGWANQCTFEEKWGSRE
jgi:hypothetical protein